MANLINSDFLLRTNTAIKLYHDYAERMPVIDYHNHIMPQEVVCDERFDNISRAWLQYDHYKWRALRVGGIAEQNITGDAGDFVKFKSFAKIMPRLINNPLYHWTHLELKRFFDIDDMLSEETAEPIYRSCNETLQSLSPKSVLKQQNVKVLCTTDDVCDDLKWHKQGRTISDFQMLPTFRADGLFHIEDAGFPAYVNKLEQAAGQEIASVGDLFAAIEKRLDVFDAAGCRMSDQSFADIFCEESGDVEAIFKKAMRKQPLSRLEADQYMTRMLSFLGAEYRRRHYTMQFRFGVVRNTNTHYFQTIGRDAGADAICGVSPMNGVKLAKMLNLLHKNDALPKTILYSLNRWDNAMITSVAGCFTGSQYPVTQGAAWWFNDTKAGIVSQLSNFAEHCVLGDFVGMVTDSRSLFSFVRHEYFRRILCDLIGGWMEAGEYENDLGLAGEIIQDICYHNAVGFLGLNDEARSRA